MARAWWRIWQSSAPRRSKPDNRSSKPRRPHLSVEGLEDRSVPSAAQFQFGAALFTAAENAGNATIAVNRTGDSAGIVTVQYSTADGTAHAGADYTAAAGTLTFADGQTSGTFNIPLLNNAQITGNDTVKLTLSSPQDGTTLGAPSNSTLLIKDLSGTQTQRFVTQAFQDLLNRAPAQSGLTYWSNLIDNGKITRSRLVQIIEGTSEFRKQLITNAFQTILGRDPSAASLTLVENNMVHGMSLETIQSQLYGSKEYYTNNGGTRASFLSAVFHDLTGKTIDSASLTQYATMLANGKTRGQVALAIINRTDALQLRVKNYFNEFLHRDPAQAGLNAAVNALRNGTTDIMLIGTLVHSAEYYSNLA